MNIKFINHLDPFLEQVIALGKRNSATLGLMPRDAYIDQAKKKCIVVTHDDDMVIGFCLFRIAGSKDRIGITQVCIHENHRNRGIPKILLDAIQNKYQHQFAGMLVSCREDYTHACKLWEKYGFVILKRTRSRSSEEKYLLKFWFEFGRPNLFTQEVSTLKVVLDVNIIIKLRDCDSSIEEVHFLMSDWLIDEVDFFYAKETLNEIHRDQDHKRTDLTRQYLSNNFKSLTCNPKEIQKYLPKLETLHPGESANYFSDRKQIAECKACEAEYFITIDSEILTRREAIQDYLNIRILRPSEFILELDELKNKQLYEPARLQGARYTIQKINSSQLASCIDIFLNKSHQEKKAEFQQVVFNTVSDSQNSCVKVIISPENEKICIFGIKYQIESIEVPFVRLKENVLRNTLFNQILTEFIRDAVNNQKSIIDIQEKSLPSDFISILIRNGFFKLQNSWCKIALSGICHSDELLDRYSPLGQYQHFTETLGMVSSLNKNEKNEFLFDIERKLWPLKLSNIERPVFIVPIKPYWASQLFDSISANSFIFGAPPELSWSRENVYYRSVKPNLEKYPGLILWYASEQKDFPRKKAIVACSYLNNVEIGEAKRLFTVFKRYGVYKWKEIFKLAGENSRNPIKALQFSDTEVFEKPIKLKRVQEIMLSENFKKNTFTSPVKVNSTIFNKIYKEAKQIK